MLSGKTDRLWKNDLIGTRSSTRRLYVLLLFISFGMIGCSNKPETVSDTIVDDSKVLSIEGNEKNEAEDIAETYREIYDEAVNTNKADRLEVMRSIVERLGENGLVAVDSENQIDMTETEQVIRFCEQVDAATEGELTIIVASYSGGFTKYDLNTEGGNVDIVREYYQYADGRMEHRSTGTYRADVWKYTEEGYLLFEGYWFSEEYFILTLNDMPERVALRVEPLDEKCRELNRQYIFPISYERNNMFIVDWSEDDFGELNLYDLFDIFYPLIYGQRVPYVPDEDLGVGAVYRIPKEEFEAVLMAYFNMDSETLQSKTTYFSEDATYEYKPRGFYEAEYPEIPYPEVVNYVENDDGTMTLTVNAVFPDQIVSKVYAHEVVIRPLDDGGVQYVSNRIIPSEDNFEATWNTPRLTEEEWEKIYGDIE